MELSAPKEGRGRKGDAMKERLFPKPAIETKHRTGMLGAHFDCFIKWMQEREYAYESMRYNIQRITNFAGYLRRRGIRSVEQLEGAEGMELLIAYQKYCKRKGYSDRSSSIRLYLQALREAGVLSGSPPDRTPAFRKFQAYLSFLKNRKGLSENTVRNHRYWVEKFLKFLSSQEGFSLTRVSIQDVDKFILQGGGRYARSTQQLIAGCLRGFFRFLYQSGKTDTDLSYLIASPRCYKLASLPRVLTWEEVNKLLGHVDMSTKAGLRNDAILLILTTYGIRAGEVARLQLDDIDWKKETIRIIPGKTGRELLLPLMPRAGKAVLKYLKHARPASKYREVFLLTCAPRRPLKSTNIRYVVARHIRLAGLDSPRQGPHLLRYSFATHLLRSGASLKEIGDMLGHRSPASTHVYTKTATEKLREVALEIPEVK